MLDLSSVYTIAEMSGNHNGKYENALDILRAAKEAGADAIKMQAYTPDSLTIDCDEVYFKVKKGMWKGYNLYELYSKAQTPLEWMAPLKKEADRLFG